MLLQMLLAQGNVLFSVGHWVKVIIIVAALIAIGYVILRQLGVQIPPFIVTIFWILVAVVIGLVALNFLSTMI
jgi:hypothetical protein